MSPGFESKMVHTPLAQPIQFSLRIFYSTKDSSKLRKISIPTLIITGTDDTNVPTQNSLIIEEKNPGAWLIQIKDAGHQLPGQYPDKINKIIQTFLSTTGQNT